MEKSFWSEEDGEELFSSLPHHLMCMRWGFRRGVEVLRTAGLDRPISNTTLVGRCWPPGARPHSASALTLLETLRLLWFQRRRASRQRRPGETALSWDLWIAYLKLFNPLHHLRPPFTLWQLQRRRRRNGGRSLWRPASRCPRLICFWSGNLHLGKSQMGEGVNLDLRLHVKFSYHWSRGVGSWLRLAPVRASRASHFVQVSELSICFDEMWISGDLLKTQKVFFLKGPEDPVSPISFLIWAMLHEHTIFCQSWNSFSYFTLEISVFVFFTVLSSPVWGGRSSIGKRWYWISKHQSGYKQNLNMFLPNLNFVASLVDHFWW